MDGEIVAATSADDLRHLLRRLLISRKVDTSQIEDLMTREQAGEPVLSFLLESIPEDTLASLLYDRFVENLTRFLGSAAKPRFSHLPAVFEDNFQLGHDPDTLLQSCADAWDDAMSVELSTVVFPGTSPARNGLQQTVLDRLGTGSPISSLLIQLPAEPFSARALIARMLRARVLDTTEQPEPDTLTEDLPRRALQLNTEDDLDLGVPLSEEWKPEGDTPVSVGPLMDAPPPTLDDEDDEPPTVGPDDEPARDPTSSEPADDSEGAGDLRSLQAWMNHGVEAEEDLEVFADHDDVRGGDDDAGTFSTEQHNLDRVEVSALEPETEPIEVDEAPSHKFSAPVLSDEDAQNKVAVAQSVLRAISAALDESKGRGRGQSALQLLFDGSPGQYKPLLTKLKAADDGSLPESALLRNLQHRPASEHRRLLNQGLLNLIDRYLAVAVEELPDEAIDHLYEGVAGYRQRLGI